MSLSRRQSLALLASAFAPRLSFAQQGPPATPATGPATGPALSAGQAGLLRSHCDGLLARAVRSPYGWGWSEDEAGVDLARTKPRAKPPVIDAGLTAAVGMVLHLCGEATSEPAYRAAAAEAARGTLAVQTRTGQVRGRGVMGAFGGTKDEAVDVPDRRPTRAALALLATVLSAQPQPDVRLKGPAVRAAHWLAGQQTNLGGWPTLYPADAPKGQGVRLLRLDEADHRDSALAVLLAAEALADRHLQTYFERSADHLIAVRVSAGRPPVRALWPAACKLDGDPNTRQPGLPTGVDLLGCRHALEVLLAGYMVTLHERYNVALKEARDALSGLPRAGEQKAGEQKVGEQNGGPKAWHRRYDMQLRPIARRADTQPAGFFAPPPPAPGGPIEPTGDPRTPELFARVERSQEIGGKRLADELSARLPLRRRLALVVAGFAPDALLVDAVQDAGGGEAAVPLGSGGGAVAAMVIAAWREFVGGRGR